MEAKPRGNRARSYSVVWNASFPPKVGVIEVSAFDPLRTFDKRLRSRGLSKYCRSWGSVRRRAGMIVGIAVCCLSVAATATTIMLPVAPGQPGNGPWTVETWPNDGCADCGIDQADLAEAWAVASDLLTSGLGSTTHSRLPVYVVRGGLDDGQTSVAKLKKALADCKLGSSGMLSPNNTTHLVAFGLRIDCEKEKRSNFVSVVIGDDHLPRAIYWMPDGPIIAADVH